MNTSTVIFLVNDTVRAVDAMYETDPNKKRTTFKTLDQTIKVGDLAVVPTDTRHKFTVVKVVDVDVNIDLESPITVDWIVAKIDLTDHELVSSQEADMIKVIKSAETRRKREELAKALMADNKDAILALPIAGLKPAPTE